MKNTYLTPDEVQSARRLMASAERVVILTHMSPDGDALGSSLALRHYLLTLDKQVTNIVPNAFPSFLAWMPGADEVLVYEEESDTANARIEQADLIICTDFNEPKRIGPVGDKLLASPARKMMVDHHLHPADFADVTISYPDSPSASQLVYELLEDVPHESAVCVYTGMMTDTGNFSFNSNHPDIYETIAELVARGVDKDAIYNRVFNTYSEDRMRLMGYCLSEKMQVFPEHHTALIFLTREELNRYHFQPGDAEGLVNLPLQIADVYYSCFMREETNLASNKVKISLRSQGDRPVNVLAHDVFDGGGHANASGGSFYGSVYTAKSAFLKAYKQYFRRD